jgi:hypothetical protein
MKSKRRATAGEEEKEVTLLTAVMIDKEAGNKNAGVSGGSGRWTKVLQKFLCFFLLFCDVFEHVGVWAHRPRLKSDDVIVIQNPAQRWLR